MISYEDSKEIFGLDENCKVDSMIDNFIAECEIEAEDAEAERKKVSKRIKSLNNVMIRLMNEYKKDPDFNLINFAGFVPQVIGKETQIVKPQ